MRCVALVDDSVSQDNIDIAWYRQDGDLLTEVQTNVREGYVKLTHLFRSSARAFYYLLRQFEPMYDFSCSSFFLNAMRMNAINYYVSQDIRGPKLRRRNLQVSGVSPKRPTTRR